MPQYEQFSNNRSFNLAAALSSGATTLTPPSYSGHPVSGQFRIKIESEIILVTDAATHPYPINRGQEGTTAVSHVLGALASLVLTAGALDQIVGVSDDGVLVAATRDIDFTGAGVTVTNVAGVATVDIPGGGSSADMTPSGTGHAHGLAPDPPASAGTTKFLREDASWAVPPGSGGGSGTVTSVGVTVPSDESVSGSPVTGAGTIAITRNAQSGRKVLASPADGSSAAPAFRALVAADVPAVPVVTPSGSGHAAGLAPDTPASSGSTKFLREDATWAVPAGGGATDMTPSGSGHAAGLAPDPGASAGTTKFLREDATWQVPAGGGGGGAAIGSTALGSEPGSPATGDLDLYTSAPYIARWSGSVWNRWRSEPLTDPSLGSWSWDNQQSSTITAIKGALSLHVPPSGGNLPSFRYKTAPSTPYTVDAIIIAEMAVLNDYLAYGIGFRESATGKIIILDFAPASSPRFYVRRYTDSSNYASDLASVAYQPPAPTFLRIADDGTNLTFSWSYSGITYIQLATQARTTFFTSAPNQVCFFGQGASGTNPCDVTLLSWTES